MKTQAKNSVDRYVDMRLKDWARWEIACLEHGHGYPSKSLEGRLRDDGGVLSKSTAIPMPPINEEAEHTALLINQLHHHKVFWALAIKICYLHNGALAKIRQSNMSLATYKTNLRLATAWLAGRISS